MMDNYVSIPDPGIVYSSTELAVVFLQSFQHVLGNLEGEERTAALSYVTSILGSSSFLMSNPEEFAEVTKALFSDIVARDFVFMLQKVFFGRWLQGRGPEVVGKLAVDIAMGMVVCPDGASTATTRDMYNAVPADIAGYMQPYSEVVNLLNGNLWFMIVCMLPLYLNLADIDKLAQ